MSNLLRRECWNSHGTYTWELSAYAVLDKEPPIFNAIFKRWSWREAAISSREGQLECLCLPQTQREHNGDTETPTKSCRGTIWGAFRWSLLLFQLTGQSYALEIEPSGSGDIERTRYGTYRILFRMQIARYKEPAHKEAQLPVKGTQRSSRTNKEWLQNAPLFEPLAGVVY